VIKNTFIRIAFLFFAAGLAYPQIASEPLAYNEPELSLSAGEDFTYLVRYAFLNLGEIRIKITEEEIINDRSFFSAEAYIDSYDGLPFINLHQIYKSKIDENYFPVYFIGIMLEDDTTFTEYNFFENNRVQVKRGNYRTKRLWIDSSAVLDRPHQDGLSILFYTRMNFGEEKTDSIPCFVNEKAEITTINFFNKVEPVSIDAVDYDIACRKLKGETDFVSVFGLTGKFEGWFSYDHSSVPIHAKMNVIIGSITLELINWNRKQWNPPEYSN
jgi:hypothetical protein